MVEGKMKTTYDTILVTTLPIELKVYRRQFSVGNYLIK